MTTKREEELLVSVSLMSGAATLVPLPVVGDLFAAGLRRTLVERLARGRGVAISPKAAGHIAGDPLKLGAAAPAALGRLGWRRLARSLSWILRVDEAAMTYLLGLYVLHYLESHHVTGTPIDDARGEAIAAAIARARRGARFDLLFKLTRDALAAAGSQISGMALSALAAARALVTRSKRDAADIATERVPPEAVSAARSALDHARTTLREGVAASFDAAWVAG
ncbi:MAG: hypothetical protein KC503_33775 [Myxococcales bacterium]|nr:hypothetical protein [Myxococcales bacterium]